MQNRIEQLKVRDLRLFAVLSRTRSIRETSRRLQCSPGQVSKLVAMLEKKLEIRLFERSTKGVSLTQYGNAVQPIIEEMLSASERLGEVTSPDQGVSRTVLAWASTSFLTTNVVARVVADRITSGLNDRYRLLDLAPDQMTIAGLRSAFDICLHVGLITWPKSWETKKVGDMNWVLCGRQGHPLLKKPAVEEVLKYPFIVPTYWTAEGLMRGNDHFPIPMAKRIIHVETATADAAIAVAQNTDHVAFLPEILVNRNRLVVIYNKDFAAKVPKPVYLSVRTDLVTKKVFESLRENVRKYLTP